LDVSVFAEHIETKFVSETLGELAHELPLRSAIAIPEGMDAIYLGKQGGDLARKVRSLQPFEKMLVGRFAVWREAIAAR
jgi:hypothetical protein